MKKCMAALCLTLVFTAFPPAAWLSYADEEPEIIRLEKGYTSVDSFSEGIAETELYLERGFIDKNGKEIVPPKYNHNIKFSEGLAKFHVGEWGTGKYGFIDKAGKIVVQPKYDYAYDFSEGLARVRLDGNFGFIDKTGNEVVPPKYDHRASDFSDGMAKVYLDGKYGFIDKAGKIVVQPKYDYRTSDFSEGMAAAEWAMIKPENGALSTKQERKSSR